MITDTIANWLAKKSAKKLKESVEIELWRQGPKTWKFRHLPFNAKGARVNHCGKSMGRGYALTLPQAGLLCSKNQGGGTLCPPPPPPPSKIPVTHLRIHLRPAGCDPGLDHLQKYFFWQFLFPWVDLALLKRMKNFSWEKNVWDKQRKTMREAVPFLTPFGAALEGPSAA